MLKIIQCPKCKYGESFKWDLSVPSPDNLGEYVCSQWSEKIPDYVIEAEKDCPKFKEK